MSQILNPVQYELLRKQLWTMSVGGEIIKQVNASHDIQGVVRTLMLGLSEMLGFHQVALLSIDPQNFTLKMDQQIGLTGKITEIQIPLGLEGGYVPDALFLNKHVICDPIEDWDPFAEYKIERYAAFPITASVYQEDGSIMTCNNNLCPCHKANNALWWTPAGFPNSEIAPEYEHLDEDARRKLSVECSEIKCYGILWFDLSDRHSFISAEEVSTISFVLSQSALMFEKMRIQRKLQSSNLLLEEANSQLEEVNKSNLRDMNRARRIQSGLLPKVFPTGIAKDVAAFYEPASRVGGDYYDIFHIPNTNTLALIVGDVSGHGVAAGLIMSMFKVLLKTWTTEQTTPGEVLQKINKAFLTEVKSDHYVTVFLAFWNPGTRILTYANSGHVPIYLNQKGHISRFESDSLFVGVMDDFEPINQNVHIPEAGRLLLYTDGICEAFDTEHVSWGSENLEESFKESTDLSAQECVQHIVKKVSEHSEDMPAADDWTVFIVDL